MDKRHRTIIRLCIFTLILATTSLWQFTSKQHNTVLLAVAKGSAMLEMISLPSITVNSNELQTIVHDTLLTRISDQEASLEFVNAVPLSYGEAKPWREAGCVQNSCAHVMYYDHAVGGTVNAIVHLETETVVGSWTDTAVRPAGSTHILERAMDIAAADQGVTAVLGDIGDADPAMVPMSAWLADNACRQDWCVDLSFVDPAGSGKIYHVFVNMTRSEVARTFYTRGRPVLDVPEPVMQRGAYTDGCHDQYGWNVCWEMTAHDGVNFRDATFNGTEIFSSIKITQIEAWYPSWPGGYRDEVGFNASVPPFDDTLVTDLGDGFEVRQLFTEFTRWPNCICCYRYEEIVRFFANGTLETEFVSHGPGCDDLSIYRPFWRIDLDVNGGAGDTTWVWQDSAWVEAAAEMELHPLVEDIAPTGEKVIVSSGNLHYHISMARTDPLGLDEARFFILKDNEGEGEGPAATGPGDTFQPPRQWINDEAIINADLVFWYVPLLKTKKGEPWWCVPDPEPGINQCEAVLRFAPGNGPSQPTAEELAAMPTPTHTPTPAPTNTPAPSPTPRPVEGESPEEVILNAGCGACHSIGVLGEGGKVGPDLSAIALMGAERVPGMSAEAYIRESILNPNAFIPEKCPNSDCFANIMPADYGTRLTSEQIDLVVDYLLLQDGTVIAPEVIGGGADAVPLGKGMAGKQGGTTVYAPSQNALGVQMALLLIAFLLTLFVLLKQRP